MKKILFYVPAIFYTVGIIALNIILKTFSPIWYIWAVLLWLGGFLLNKRKSLGCILGLLPAVHLMHMSTQYTGQVINIELPLGLVTAIYILACGYVVWKKNRKENEHVNGDMR